MKRGVLISFDAESGINEEKFKQVRDLELDSCQVCIWNTALFTDENARLIKEYSAKYNVEVSTLWCGWSGPCYWNFYEGQNSLGLVPDDYRMMRLQELLQGANFANKLGVKNLATHVGFLPENPYDDRYIRTIIALKNLCNRLKSYGINFLFETGQETPVVIMRAIEDIGTDNIGVNIDTGNLIIYGKANPVDALDMIGKYVCDLHLKDAVYPTDGKRLGNEVRFGDGKANFKEFLPKLKALGYEGSLTIEREISGEKQIADIIYARDLIKKYWK